MAWLYMGYYIRTCQKMRYKGDYSPSQLLDPVSRYQPLSNYHISRIGLQTRVRINSIR